jgi:hypothetical protein
MPSSSLGDRRRAPTLAAWLGAPVALAILAASPWASPFDESLGTHWSGTLEFRGASMPLRLAVHESAATAGGLDDASAPHITLDLPDLLMAADTIDSARVDGGLRLTLPFGLGDLVVDLSSEHSVTESDLGGSALVLTLDRTDPPPIRHEDVSFSSADGTVLSGTLVLPEGPGPHQAFAVLHDSGARTRGDPAYRGWADLLAREGVAALLWDKRGAGESGGEENPGLRALADDGLAAIRFLAAREDIDGERLGLHGWSQGCWVAERVAAEHGAVDALLFVSAAAGTPAEQEFVKIQVGLGLGGRPAEQIDEVLAYMQRYFQVARTGEGWPELERAIAAARDQPWGDQVDQPRSLDDLAWWHENMDFQPADLIDDFDGSVLLLYAGEDAVTPAAVHAEALSKLFPSRERVALHVFPRGDHRLEVGSGPDDSGNWQWPQIAPGALDAVRSWLAEDAFR